MAASQFTPKIDALLHASEIIGKFVEDGRLLEFQNRKEESAQGVSVE